MKAVPACCCAAAVLLQGCALGSAPGESKPVPIKDALLTVEDQLQDTAPVTLGSLGDKEGESKFRDAVREAQCKDKTADPLMPVLTGPISVALQGSVSKAGAGALAAGMAATPTVSGTYTFTVTKGQQQQVTFPYSFVPVSGLANFYLSQNVGSLSNLPNGDPKDKVVAALNTSWGDINTVVGKIKTESQGLNWADTTICKPAEIPGPAHTIIPYFKRIPLQLN